MKTFRQRKSQLGQGMTEYIIIVALVAIGALGVYKYFSQTVNNTTAMAVQSLAGTSTATTRTAATDGGTGAGNAAAVKKTMANFQNNSQ